MEACSCCRNAVKVFYPSRATEFASAGTNPPDASSFLARSNLAHFNTDVEGVGKNLDELTEVYALVCDIVENRFVAVALIFHVANLHVKIKILGNLARLNHRVVLA